VSWASVLHVLGQKRILNWFTFSQRFRLFLTLKIDLDNHKIQESPFTKGQLISKGLFSILNSSKKRMKQARKGFRPPSAIFVIQTFLGIFWRIFLEDFFGGTFYRNFFGGIFWRNFFGEIVLDKHFWRIFGGFFERIFWEDFLGGYFGRNSLFTLVKLFEYGRS
jgi:hypothetical protein